jgi:hypothetical protein
MLRPVRLLLLLAVMGVKKGDTMYVKGDGVNMFAKPSLVGVPTPLPAGAAVTWNGPAPGKPSAQQITWKGKKGYVHQSALTPFKAEPADASAPSAEAAASPPRADAALPGAGFGRVPKNMSDQRRVVYDALLSLAATNEEERRKVKQ